MNYVEIYIYPEEDSLTKVYHSTPKPNRPSLYTLSGLQDGMDPRINLNISPISQQETHAGPGNAAPPMSATWHVISLQSCLFRTSACGTGPSDLGILSNPYTDPWFGQSLFDYTKTPNF